MVIEQFVFVGVMTLNKENVLGHSLSQLAFFNYDFFSKFFVFIFIPSICTYTFAYFQLTSVHLDFVNIFKGFF